MEKELTKDEVVKNKEKAIRCLDLLLEDFINDPTHLKKANLISYWIKDYVTYINFEEKFDSSRLIRYPRGSVIKVNLGFNVGKELGGLHFAVVIDNDNKRNADVLTIIPLSSTDGKNVHPRNADLGSELFQKINDVQNTLMAKAHKELLELQKIDNAFTNTINILEELKTQNIEENQQLLEIAKRLAEAFNYKNEIESRQAAITQTIDTINRNNREIAKLKAGSMAVVNQITTVSKQRIFTPKRSEDFLYGIRLSSTAMEKINDKIKELFIRE